MSAPEVTTVPALAPAAAEAGRGDAAIGADGKALRNAVPSVAADEAAVLAGVYPMPRLELVRGRGAVAFDATGRGYLDFTCGIAVNALGHAPPAVARAVARQLRTMTHVSNLFANRPAAELARALVDATGHARVFFCNSGTEGVDAAIKFARLRARALGRPGRDVLAFRGGFHGRTGFALSATWNPSYRVPFEPLIPGIRFAPFNEVAELSDVLDAGVAAVIVEPVQGESGAVPARREFLEALRVRTAALGVTLIFDEVQSGMGRCGRLLAAEHYGVHPDVTVLSKALGGGLPLGAVLLDEDVARHLSPGVHGCTFGGGAVAAVAGKVVLDRVRRPGFLARVRSRGRALAAGLDALAASHPTVREARGLGLLRAVELHAEAPFDPAALVTAARERGLLLVRGGDRAVRVLPPLTVTPHEIASALDRLDAALTALEEDSMRKEKSP